MLSSEFHHRESVGGRGRTRRSHVCRFCLFPARIESRPGAFVRAEICRVACVNEQVLAKTTPCSSRDQQNRIASVNSAIGPARRLMTLPGSEPSL
jgi:hypothetical protein